MSGRLLLDVDMPIQFPLKGCTEIQLMCVCVDTWVLYANRLKTTAPRCPISVLSLAVTDDLDIFSAMIPRDEGNALIQVLRDGLVQGSLIPMNCKRGNSNNADGKDQGWCRPATQADRQLIQGLPLVR